MGEGSCLGGKASWGWAAEKGAAEVTRTWFLRVVGLLYFIYESVVLYLIFVIKGYTQYGFTVYRKEHGKALRTVGPAAFLLRKHM